MQLLGEYSVELEDSTRLAIPEPLLDAMGRKLLVEKADGAPYLLGFWSEKMLRKSRGTRGTALMVLCDGGVVVEADHAGFISLPPGLLEGAAGHDLVLCGNGNHAELWEKSAWAEYRNTMAADLGLD